MINNEELARVGGRSVCNDYSGKASKDVLVLEFGLAGRDDKGMRKSGYESNE